MSNKTFAGFVIGLSKRDCTEARSVVLYVKKRTENMSHIMERIKADFKLGRIDAARFERLSLFIKELHTVYLKSGHIVDSRDPKDWADIGNGARMHAVHKDSDQSNITNAPINRQAYLSAVASVGRFDHVAAY